MNYKSSLCDGKWFDGIQKLRPGDFCEVRFPARSYWMQARLISNGGSGYWEAELMEEVFDEVSGNCHPIGHRIKGIYAEHVRAWEGCHE